MLKIAICDDEQNMCSAIETLLCSAAEELGLAVDTEVFYSGESLYKYLAGGSCFDLIFLDIEMDGMNGIDVSDKLRGDFEDIDTEIVYVTCTTQYDRMLFDYHPLAFIPKPPEKEQIQRALTLAAKKKQIREPYFSFSYQRQVQTVPFSKILYFESENRKVRIVTDAANYSYYGNLSGLCPSLPSYFFQVHRSYIVNLHQIARYGGREITMSDGLRISIGKNYREAFLQLQPAELDEEVIS